VVDLWHHIYAIKLDWSIYAIAQRDMQDSPIFRTVDLPAIEHHFNRFAKTCLASQVHEQRYGLLRYSILGEIEENFPKFERKLLEAIRILVEKVAHVHTSPFFLVFGQGLPGWRKSKV